MSPHHRLNSFCSNVLNLPTPHRALNNEPHPFASSNHHFQKLVSKNQYCLINYSFFHLSNDESFYQQNYVNIYYKGVEYRINPIFVQIVTEQRFLSRQVRGAWIIIRIRVPRAFVYTDDLQYHIMCANPNTSIPTKPLPLSTIFLFSRPPFFHLTLSV